MCVKLIPRDLNPGPYPPHPTSTYTCGVTTASMVHGGEININIKHAKMFMLINVNKHKININI